MKNRASGHDEQRDGTLLLPLTEVKNLFRTPEIEPFSESPSEVLGVSGFDYLLELLHQDKRQQRSRMLVLVVPVDEALNAGCEELADGLHRLARSRMEQQRRELAKTCRYGWHVAAVALLILASCIALSSIFSSPLTAWMRPLTRTVLERGFEIVGWVVLWHPIEVLGFTPLNVRARIAALQTLARIEVIIRPERVPALPYNVIAPNSQN